jgi:hypothetical protein
MRLMHLMILVCAMLLLALIPACLQYGRLVGVQPMVSLTTVSVVALLAFAAVRRA